jgi:hypothetical protein
MSPAPLNFASLLQAAWFLEIKLVAEKFEQQTKFHKMP